MTELKTVSEKQNFNSPQFSEWYSIQATKIEQLLKFIKGLDDNNGI